MGPRGRRLGWNLAAFVILALVALWLIGLPKIKQWLHLTRATIHYQVHVREGGTIPIVVRYRLPSGEERSEQRETPWASGDFSFVAGDELFVEAETDEPIETTLVCTVVGRGDEGAWSGYTGDPVRCATNYELGQWPPDDNSGPLIRVPSSQLPNP